MESTYGDRHDPSCTGVWAIVGKFFGLSRFRCATCGSTRTLEF